MKKIFTILLIVLIGFTASAQEVGGTLTGVITDAETGETLIGANVIIVGTYKAASSDFEGKYVLDKVKQGDYSIKFSYIGYAEKIYNGISFKEGKTMTINVALTTKTNAIEEVEIVGAKSLVNLEEAKSSVTISQKDIADMNVRDVQ